MQDTSTDYEELANSIQAGYYIKNGIANDNEDLFYMSTFISVSAKTYEELLWRKQQMTDLLKSMDMFISECNFQQEAALQSIMPFLKIAPKLEKQLQEKYSDVASIYRSEPFFIEIMPKDVNKATSLDHMLEGMGLTRENAICCGDGYNDISMIEYAGTGVAWGMPSRRSRKLQITSPVLTMRTLVEVIDKFIMKPEA